MKRIICFVLLISVFCPTQTFATGSTFQLFSFLSKEKRALKKASNNLREKEKNRIDYFTKSQFPDYATFDAQYRITAFRELLKEKSIIDTMTWTNLGPFAVSGRVVSIALDPEDEHTMWVGSASGGLWKSENGGGTWTHVTKNLPSMAVYALAIHPSHPDTMLIGTATAVSLVSGLGMNSSTTRGAGVFISVDGGNNWTEAGLKTRPTKKLRNGNRIPVNSRKLVWHTTDPNWVYLASDGGLFKYSTREDQWFSVFTGANKKYGKEPVVDIFVNSHKQGQEGEALDMMVVGLANSGILVSKNGGQTWVLKNEGLPLNGTKFILGNLTQSKFNPNVLYAKLINKNNRNASLYKTTNGGKQWIHLKDSPEKFWSMAVSPHDPDLVMGGGINLFRSTSGGEKARRQKNPIWENVNHQKGCFDIVHVDQRGFAFSESNPELIYTINDGGVYRSLDRGRCWMAMNFELSTMQIYSMASSPHDSVTLSIGTQDQGVLLTSSHGRTWTKRVTGDGGISLFDSRSKDTLYVTAQYGNHWKLIRGDDPRPIGSGINNGQGTNPNTSLYLAPLAIDHESTNILYTATLKSIFKSINGGENWKAIVDIDTISIITTDINNPAIVYAYSRSKGKVFRSLNRGKTWLEPTCDTCELGNDVIDLVADPDKEGVVYATRTSLTEQIWRSEDSGKTWQNFTDNYDENLRLPVQGIAIVPQAVTGTKLIYIGTDLGVFMKKDGLKKWRFMGGDVPYAIVTDIHYHDVDNTIRIATFGRGVWKMNIPVPEKKPQILVMEQ